MLRQLISYPYLYKNKFWQEFLVANARRTEVLMDSGAFTAFRSGEPVNLAAYSKTCHALAPFLWNYVQLDVVRDQDASLRNLDLMVKDGLRPMPVLTLDGSPRLAESFVEVNEWICVAGGVTESFEYFEARLEQTQRASGNRSKLHGLGFTPSPRVARTCVASIDSSTWVNGQRFGMVTAFDPVSGVIKQMPWGEIKRKPSSKWPPMLRDMLFRYGVSGKILASEDGCRGVGSYANILTAFSWIEITRYFDERNVRLFFAASTPQNTLCLLAAAEGRGDLQRARAAFDKLYGMRKTSKDIYLRRFVELCATS